MLQQYGVAPLPQLLLWLVVVVEPGSGLAGFSGFAGAPGAANALPARSTATVRMLVNCILTRLIVVDWGMFRAKDRWLLRVKDRRLLSDCCERLLDDEEKVGDSKAFYIFWSSLSGADKRLIEPSTAAMENQKSKEVENNCKPSSAHPGAIRDLEQHRGGDA